MSIFQALKRHPEICVIFLASFLAIFTLLDGAMLSYALGKSGANKIFSAGSASSNNLQNKYRGYPASPAPKTKTNYVKNANVSTNSYSQNLLTIPKIEISAPIIYSLSNNEEDIQRDLEKGVAHFNNTAMPGEIGKILIIGHSSAMINYKGGYGHIFTALNDLFEGDTIYIYSKNKKYAYRVFKKEITEPVLKNLDKETNDSILTLMTCWPPGTSWKRLFVYAELIK